MPNYQLVNPKVEGSDFKNKFSGETPIEAATEAWKKISFYFSNPLPNYKFTIQDKNNKLFHFNVNESHDKEKEVNFTLTEFKGKTDEKGFHKSLKQFEQNGGSSKHRKDDDDSSSSDDSPRYRRIKYPLSLWWYYPALYTSSADGNLCYQPSWIYPYSPYLNVVAWPYIGLY